MKHNTAQGFMSEMAKGGAAIAPGRFIKNLNLGRKTKATLKNVGPDKLNLPKSVNVNPPKFKAPTP